MYITSKKSFETKSINIKNKISEKKKELKIVEDSTLSLDNWIAEI